MREHIHSLLKWAPGALGGALAFAAMWETPRNWIGARFAALWVAMSSPILTILITLGVVAHFYAIFATSPNRQTAKQARAETAAEAAREQEARRRELINDGRRLAA